MEHTSDPSKSSSQQLAQPMPSDRLETLLQFVESSPNDAFVRYGLAQEYVNRGQLEKAIEEFNTLLTNNADYQAGYYHAGQTYLKLGRKDEARVSFEKGIELATRSGDLHARGELEAALAEL